LWCYAAARLVCTAALVSHVDAAVRDNDAARLAGRRRNELLSELWGVIGEANEVLTAAAAAAAGLRGGTTRAATAAAALTPAPAGGPAAGAGVYRYSMGKQPAGAAAAAGAGAGAVFRGTAAVHRTHRLDNNSVACERSLATV
jgi:hypothetical protein